MSFFSLTGRRRTRPQQPGATLFFVRENQGALARFQREKAVAAAAKIEQFIKEIERQLRGTVQDAFDDPVLASQQREEDYLRLLRNVPAVTDIRHFSAAGREEVRVSRLDLDVNNSQEDHSQDPHSSRRKMKRLISVRFISETSPNRTLPLLFPKLPGLVASPLRRLTCELFGMWSHKSKSAKPDTRTLLTARGCWLPTPTVAWFSRSETYRSFPSAFGGGHGTGSADDENFTMVVPGVSGNRVLTARATIAPLDGRCSSSSH